MHNTCLFCIEMPDLLDVQCRMLLASDIIIKLVFVLITKAGLHPHTKLN